MSDLRSLLKGIRLLVCDVDGILTDGRLTYGDGGEASKTFHARDGLGLKMLMANGVEVGVLSARSGAAVAKRMAELGIPHVILGRGDKRRALLELLDKRGITPEHTAYIGDDVLDLPAIRMVGIGATVADGHDSVKAEAQFVTTRSGGHGAVRELCDAIVEAKVGMATAIEKLLEAQEKKS